MSLTEPDGPADGRKMQHKDDPRMNQVKAWVQTVPPGVYRSSELLAMFQAADAADAAEAPPANVFGWMLRQLGAELLKMGGVRRVKVFDPATMRDRAAAVARAPLASSRRNPRDGRTVSVHLTDEQSAWVAATAHRQGNTESAVIRFALAAAIGRDGGGR